MNEIMVTAPPARRVAWPAVAAGALLTLLTFIGLALVGELGAFVLAGLNVLPFVGLALLAGLGETRRWARWSAYGYLFLLGLGLLGISALFVLAATVGPLYAAPPLQNTRPPGLLRLLAESLRPVLLYLTIGGGLLLVALLPLLRGVRRRLAPLLPINPASVTHTVGLGAVVMLALLPTAALLVLGGRPPLLLILAKLGEDASRLGLRSPVQQQLDLLYGLIWLLPSSLVLVGYPLRRRAGAALVRLGLVRPSARQILLGLGAAVALVLLALPLDWLIAWLWGAAGWPRTDAQLFEKLMAGLISPIGAVVVGVTAGLGEEVAVRGVLQPRVGLLLANAAFTAMHAYQYGFDGLLSVFLVGLALGLLRARTNTTTSAITHGAYNFILVLAAALGLG